MIISDLNYLEVISQETEIQGAGYASAVANAFANSLGQDISDTTTGTSTFTASFPGFKAASASAGSSSYAV